jgi:hypothetical protein
LEGIPLENNGAVGSLNSHWAKLFMPTEMMNPSDELNGKLSPFTLKLLEETGWYSFDSEIGEAYDLGRDDGCQHF